MVGRPRLPLTRPALMGMEDVMGDWLDDSWRRIPAWLLALLMVIGVAFATWCYDHGSTASERYRLNRFYAQQWQRGGK